MTALQAGTYLAGRFAVFSSGTLLQSDAEATRMDVADRLFADMEDGVMETDRINPVVDRHDDRALVKPGNKQTDEELPLDAIDDVMKENDTVRLRLI